MSDEKIKFHKQGDRLYFDDLPGCFLCGWKSDDWQSLGMNFVRLHEVMDLSFLFAPFAHTKTAASRPVMTNL